MLGVIDRSFLGRGSFGLNSNGSERYEEGLKRCARQSTSKAYSELMLWYGEREREKRKILLLLSSLAD